MSGRVICLGCAALRARPALALAERFAFSMQCICGAIEPWQIRELRAQLNELEARASRERR